MDGCIHAVFWCHVFPPSNMERSHAETQAAKNRPLLPCRMGKSPDVIQKGKFKASRHLRETLQKGLKICVAAPPVEDGLLDKPGAFLRCRAWRIPMEPCPDKRDDSRKNGRFQQQMTGSLMSFVTAASRSLQY